ncbi:FHA domain-containing protein [Oscillochloris sp. ZM17-4]|uniref:FHA domain-containing protein n=1 Tax=Oscillochloris sp. ZM17-4 TaxID=2866714 RepID=UPI001C73558D|nr:FHA domain-containing protein [Oscillochloris sp. ZM17-4]MBX0331262.1 FHA domain-containing protein [Oscillochloris sp. ZM17-4]
MSAESPQLIVRFQGQLVQRTPLARDVLSIGRTPDNGLSLPHPLIARRHAELRLDEGRLTLTDMGSRTGTFIGETRLLPNQPQVLPDGAVFRIGPFEITYYESDPVEDDVPSEAAVTGLGLPATPPRQIAEPRPTYPAHRPVGPLSRYLADLPAIYQDSDFLGRYLMIIEAVWEPLEQRQSFMMMYFDPRTCPASMLPWLSGWLDMPVDRLWPEGRQRAILSEAMDLMRWRGTRFGLSRMIELSTGITPEILDEPGMAWVMRVRVTAPPAHPIDRQSLELLIQRHKPAHVGYILDVLP